MTHLIDDMLDHQAWADAEHWRALQPHPTALADKAIRQRLHHIHRWEPPVIDLIVWYWIVWYWKGRPVAEWD